MTHNSPLKHPKFPVNSNDSEVAPPPVVVDLCSACIRYVHRKYEYMLDYSSDTLSFVDQYVRDAQKEIAVLPESLQLVSASIGAYLGETIRRAFGARWSCLGEHDTWRLYFTGVYMSFNPIGMAREALLLDGQEGWNAHLHIDPAEHDDIEARLASLPGLSESDYYLPSHRFDVVLITYEALRAKLISQNRSDVQFDIPDYD